MGVGSRPLPVCKFSHHCLSENLNSWLLFDLCITRVPLTYPTQSSPTQGWTQPMSVSAASSRTCICSAATVASYSHSSWCSPSWFRRSCLMLTHVQFVMLVLVFQIISVLVSVSFCSDHLHIRPPDIVVGGLIFYQGFFFLFFAA